MTEYISYCMRCDKFKVGDRYVHLEPRPHPSTLSHGYCPPCGEIELKKQRELIKQMKKGNTNG